MKQEKDKATTHTNTNKSGDSNLGTDKDFRKMSEAGNSGIFSRISNKFNDALQSGRSSGQSQEIPPSMAKRSADDVALMRARSTKTQKMYIPNGVIIEGSLTGGSETEIHGRIEGNITVDGILFIGKTALITGNVRADACQVEGLIEGKVECSNNLFVAATGRLAANALAGKQIRIAGQIEGNATTPGTLRIEAGGIVNGDVKTRVFSMDDGATLNGCCVMRTPSQKEGSSPEKK
ncbi:MAG: polymer-forming cytoskeletal protein [Candidatus Hydrogenedentes bacterium]|nr:polymer-forming cytoskeletal protein [Candidatus Hydrogenedentota bacterium]